MIVAVHIHADRLDFGVALRVSGVYGQLEANSATCPMISQDPGSRNASAAIEIVRISSQPSQ